MFRLVRNMFSCKREIMFQKKTTAANNKVKEITLGEAKIILSSIEFKARFVQSKIPVTSPFLICALIQISRNLFVNDNTRRGSQPPRSIRGVETEKMRQSQIHSHNVHSKKGGLTIFGVLQIKHKKLRDLKSRLFFYL